MYESIIRLMSDKFLVLFMKKSQNINNNYDNTYKGKTGNIEKTQNNFKIEKVGINTIFIDIVILHKQLLFKFISKDVII